MKQTYDRVLVMTISYLEMVDAGTCLSTWTEWKGQVFCLGMALMVASVRK